MATQIFTVRDRYITTPGQLGFPPFNVDDGLGLAVKDGKLCIYDSIIDMKDVPLEKQDEALAITYGSSAEISRCVIRNVGKLFLCGSGDKDHRPDEKGKTVIIRDSILENFGRRGPEVQCEMECRLINCLIQDWGHPDYFTVRAFGAWAHDGGFILAENCVFINEITPSLSMRLKDKAYHFSQSISDNGLKAIFKRQTYISGWRRGLTASDTGKVSAINCYADDGIIIEGEDGTMDESDAANLIKRLGNMKAQLFNKLQV